MGGGVRGQNEVFVPKIGLKFPAPLINFIFCRREIFLMSGGGGGVGRPGPAKAPTPLPPKVPVPRRGIGVASSGQTAKGKGKGEGKGKGDNNCSFYQANLNQKGRQKSHRKSYADVAHTQVTPNRLRRSANHAYSHPIFPSQKLCCCARQGKTRFRLSQEPTFQ